MMLTRVSETSLAAFRSIPDADLTNCERQVMDLMADGISRTRRQIADALGWRDGPTCGRVNSLVTKVKLEESGERPDPITGRSAKVLRLPVVGQKALF
jgi:DNA-binding NarL/FixJ family response regulator